MNFDKKTPYADALSDEQLERIGKLMAENLSLEERWLSYGEAYGSSAYGSDALKRAKRAVADRLNELQRYLCKDSDILKLATSQQTSVALTIAVAVTGKLVKVNFHDVDLVQLGVLVAQAGLLQICAGEL